MKHALPSLLFGLVLCAGVAGARAQALRPYPAPKVTGDQWKQYHDSVADKLGPQFVDAKQQKLQIYQDRKTGLSIAFTRFGHPAHPAWIARRLNDLPSGMEIEQVGYYAGNKAAFEQLDSEFRTLNEDIIAQSKEAAAPAPVR